MIKNVDKCTAKHFLEFYNNYFQNINTTSCLQSRNDNQNTLTLKSEYSNEELSNTISNCDNKNTSKRKYSSDHKNIETIENLLINLKHSNTDFKNSSSNNIKQIKIKKPEKNINIELNFSNNSGVLNKPNLHKKKIEKLIQHKSSTQLKNKTHQELLANLNNNLTKKNFNDKSNNYKSSTKIIIKTQNKAISQENFFVSLMVDENTSEFIEPKFKDERFDLFTPLKFSSKKHSNSSDFFKLYFNQEKNNLFLDNKSESHSKNTNDIIAFNTITSQTSKKNI